jgi:ADP-heptose:LPS heptosyltransferase
MLVHVSGDRLGDALLKYPVIKAFREAHPNTHITWVTSRRPSIFEGPLSFLNVGLLNEIHAESGLGRSLFTPLPTFLAARYDVIVATETRVIETLALMRVPHESFISPGLRFALSTRRPDRSYKGLSVYEQFRVLMSLAGGRELEPRPYIEIPPAIEHAAKTCFPPSKRYVGLSPGAGGERKRWPLARYIELARWLETIEVVPTFFLGPEDSHLAGEISERVPTAIFAESMLERHVQPGPLNTIAAARHMLCSVTNDSGGGHLIASAGQPVITLYGHTDPRKFRSPYCQHTSLVAHLLGFDSLRKLRTTHVRDALTQNIRDVLNAG